MIGLEINISLTQSGVLLGHDIDILGVFQSPSGVAGIYLNAAVGHDLDTVAFRHFLLNVLFLLLCDLDGSIVFFRICSFPRPCFR